MATTVSEDGMSLRNIDKQLPDYTVSWPRRPEFESSVPWQLSDSELKCLGVEMWVYEYSLTLAVAWSGYERERDMEIKI